ncbi:MAG: hypothetical protein U9N59_16755 [Campylobacterota bacterium]|nr:hypothetical protein [Campylobacterota bacterium]
MKRFTLKLLNKLGLTTISECNAKCTQIESYRNNTICQLKQNNKDLKKSLNKLQLNPAKLQKWSKAVREAGGHKCDICGSTDKEQLSSHHLYDKSSHPTLAFVVENGVVLCDFHHKDFHKTCQQVECTPQSYQKYKEKIKSVKSFLHMNKYPKKLSA